MRAVIDASGLSAAGPVRATNEDCFLADDELALYVVADGMGGHAAGEVASRLAVESIHNFVRRSREPGDLSWPCGIDSSLSFAGNALRTAIYLANRRVFRAAEGQDDYVGMGTTVVCALLQPPNVAIAHVGDSRLYVWSHGALQPQTRDDTWAATVLAGGGDAASLASHPMRNVLTNVVGAREQADIHVFERPLLAGEVLLLCTDGVHGVLDDPTLAGLIAPGRPAAETAASIVTAAFDRGSRDNATALVVRYLHADQGRA